MRPADPNPSSTYSGCGHATKQMDRSKLPKKVAWIDGVSRILCGAEGLAKAAPPSSRIEYEMQRWQTEKKVRCAKRPHQL